MKHECEGDSLIRRQYDTFSFTNTPFEGGTRRSPPSPPNNPMHFPQHQQADPADEDSNDSAAARANNNPRGATSRQQLYIDRLPHLPSESRDYSRTNVPVTSTESSESSSSPILQPSSIHPQHTPQQQQQRHHQRQHFAFDSTSLGAPGPLPVQPSFVVPPRSSPQHHVHNDYNNRHSPATGNNALDSAPRTHGRFIRTDDGALIEVSEEVYAVRQAALAVLDPITYCWVRAMVTFIMPYKLLICFEAIDNSFPVFCYSHFYFISPNHKKS
eukprot:scaffold22033_cov39-Cyclotella_meneghiniana.AAC.2